MANTPLFTTLDTLDYVYFFLDEEIYFKNYRDGYQAIMAGEWLL